jgi:hypothetical protein
MKQFTFFRVLNNTNTFHQVKNYFSELISFPSLEDDFLNSSDFRLLCKRYNLALSRLSLGIYEPGTCTTFTYCRRIVVAALVYRKHLIESYFFDVANPSLLRSFLRNDDLYFGLINKRRKLTIYVHHKLIDYAFNHASPFLKKIWPSLDHIIKMDANKTFTTKVLEAEQNYNNSIRLQQKSMPDAADIDILALCLVD